MTIKAKYVGDGSQFLNGVPARDLEVEEYEGLDEASRTAIEVSGLYDLVAAPKTREAPTTEEAAV